MKVTLPENSSEITLKQYIDYVNLLQNDEKDLRRKLEIFTNIPKDVGIKQKDLTNMLEQIDLALSQDSNFEYRFKMDGVDFGFIPNFDEISTKEFVDIKEYEPKAEDGIIENVGDLNKLMAILFRPITNTSYKTYVIQDYKGTSEYAKAMLQTPMNIVNGALFFFTNLTKELQSYIQKSIQGEQVMDKRQQTISINGAGMLQ